MFLLVPAYPGSRGQKAVKRLCVCLIVSLTKQVSVRFLDATAQQFTVRPTSRAELRPTDRHAYEVIADATGRAVTGHLQPSVSGSR